MKKFKLLITLVPTLGMIWTGNCFAFGMGVSSGSMEETWTDTGFGGGSSMREVTSIGLVLDSNVAANKLFNYRFRIFTEENVSSSGNSSYSGTSMTHDFGFALVRTKPVRLWLGPRFKYTFLSNDNASEATTNRFGLLYGAVLGVNINLPRVVTFSITAGKLLGDYTGDCTTFNCNDREVDSSFLNVAIIFRMGRDNY